MNIKDSRDIFWEPNLQDMEELAHTLYGCMDAHLMRLLGEEAIKHPKMAANLEALSGETYGAMLSFARRMLINRHDAAEKSEDDRVISTNDVFGRKDAKHIWTDVPKKDYDRLMSMPKEERNRILEKMEGDWGLSDNDN